MPNVLPSVKTDIEWINSFSETPIIGELFLFILIFVPAALLSFLIQLIIPFFDTDIGFTKVMLVLLPTWNILLRFLKVKLYVFFIPTWVLLPIISVIKAFIMFY